MTNITRRSALGGIALSSVLAYADVGKRATAFALIGDRYHNSDYIRTGLTRTITKDMGISVDFTDDTQLLTAETLKDYKMLIILRDGMIWPNGYPEGGRGGAGQPATPPIVSDPPLPPMAAKAEFWIKPE